jgi:hypothetical protein
MSGVDGFRSYRTFRFQDGWQLERQPEGRKRFTHFVMRRKRAMDVLYMNAPERLMELHIRL